MVLLQSILSETITKGAALAANGIDCVGDDFFSTVHLFWIKLRYITPN
jgi:hypothetical protein